MRKIVLFHAIIAIGCATCFAASAPFYITALDSAKNQLARLTASRGANYTQFPRTANGNTVVTVNYSDWTSGFFPGCLWLMYRYTNDAAWKTRARTWTDNLSQAATVNDHDVGFRIMCSYGTGLEFQTAAQYRLDTAVIMRAARTLSGRYNATVKAIKSWDSYSKNGTTYTYPVIIDNMMNLELLDWATATSHDSSFQRIAVSHAATTIKNHFRANYSSYHLVAYNAASGAVLGKMTVQGYSDASSWARGQAWGLYGFTMMYRMTKDTVYLNQARHIANYIISRLPADQVPYWDFDVPTSPTPSRDASAAAIYASALIELSGLVSAAEGPTYYQKAKAILQVLASASYTAKPNTSGNFILMHSTGNHPANSEIDVPINYADYYYLEALLRLKKVEEATAVAPQSRQSTVANQPGTLRVRQLFGSESIVASLTIGSRRPVQLSLIDTRGCVIQQQYTRETEMRLDLANLPAGCYLVQASDAAGVLGTARIVHR
jgi:unsaturated chondroitin disaccharide hydrolase